jgi:hypothetical protein
MPTDNFCFYLQHRLIQTSQTGGQQYSDPSPFSIPCIGLEQAPFVVFVYFFPSFECAKNLVIMGPNNTKNSSKSVTCFNIARILLLL